MLKVTRAVDPIEVKTLTVCVYAVPGVGKTSLGFTAEKPLLLDFDRGSYRSKNRGDVVQVERWADVQGITVDDLKDYRTLVVDTAGRALDQLAVHIIAGNPKMGRGGALTLQGYGELKSTFVAWTKLVRSFGLDIVLLCHSDEQRSGDDLIERLDMQGGSKNEVYKVADMMGRIYLSGGKRTLNFSPTDTAFGKNPGQLEPLTVPDFDKAPNFLETVIHSAKASLNAMSATQTEAASALADWSAVVDAAETMTDFDALVVPAKDAAPAIRDNAKRVLLKAAKAKGFAFNAKQGVFDLAEKAA